MPVLCFLHPKNMILIMSERRFNARLKTACHFVATDMQRRDQKTSPHCPLVEILKHWLAKSGFSHGNRLKV